jgi:N-acetylmuramoyl-L-alanine amidase
MKTAEDAGGGTKHVVAKGETLTSIAKHYNIPLAELQKANKNVNDRKLQIGQTLTIPTATTAKTPESAPEKKE